MKQAHRAGLSVQARPGSTDAPALQKPTAGIDIVCEQCRFSKTRATVVAARRVAGVHEKRRGHDTRVIEG